MSSQQSANVRSMDDHLLDKWVTAMRGARLSERTVVERKQTIARIIRYTETGAHLFTTDQLADWFASLPYEVSTNSRATYMAQIRAWQTWLVLQGVRDDDPTIRLIQPRAEKGKARPITDAQLELVLTSNLRKRTRTMILLAAYQGLRAHEIAKLRGEDIDLVSMKLDVNGKGGKRCKLPLHPVIAAEAHLYPARGYWFHARSNRFQPMHRSSASDVMRRAMHRAGVNASAHNLRHWYGSALRRAGVDLRMVQELLRHSNLATTEIYTEVDRSELGEAINLLPSVADLARVA